MDSSTLQKEREVTIPTYPYRCEPCDTEYEIIKSIKEYDPKNPDPCPLCKRPGQRVFSCNVHFIGTKIEDAEYNPGLGQITKSKRHRDELAKRMGAIEIGNENPDKMHNYFEKQREEKRKRSYEDL